MATSDQVNALVTMMQSLQMDFKEQKDHNIALSAAVTNINDTVATAVTSSMGKVKDDIMESVKTSIESKIEPVLAKQDSMEETMTAMAKHLEALQHDMSDVKAKQETHEATIASVQKEVAAAAAAVPVDDSDMSSNDGKPPPTKRGKHTPTAPHPAPQQQPTFAPGQPASSNTQWSTFGPPPTHQHQQSPAAPQHFNIGSPGPSGRPPVGAPAGWPASAAPTQQRSNNPTRLWVSGYRSDVLRTVQEKHFELIKQAISVPELRSVLTPRYRNGAPPSQWTLTLKSMLVRCCPTSRTSTTSGSFPVAMVKSGRLECMLMLLSLSGK